MFWDEGFVNFGWVGDFFWQGMLRGIEMLLFRAFNVGTISRGPPLLTLGPSEE